MKHVHGNMEGKGKSAWHLNKTPSPGIDPWANLKCKRRQAWNAAFHLNAGLVNTSQSGEDQSERAHGISHDQSERNPNQTHMATLYRGKTHQNRSLRPGLRLPQCATEEQWVFIITQEQISQISKISTCTHSIFIIDHESSMEMTWIIMYTWNRANQVSCMDL